ncbi:Helix-turn-helix domain protein [Poriferisphaera corsica]|uniref:Helix-turn-helix domain protein n=1 Tax=Poriferisphaera corsica TaxID=2528020 RepID=A0A517YPR6_9BACT|nr:helix-turn-helix domain-containing protein [Poriferisphaera corsica]QDU32212.1 Helix-turn-helix domain protein [Poriferisphaera corsica]
MNTNIQASNEQDMNDQKPAEYTQKYFTVKQIAERAGLTETTIRSYVKNKGLPVIKIGKGSRCTSRIAVDVFDKWFLSFSQSYNN